MKRIRPHLIFLLLVLLFPIIVPAQELPSLPADGNIRTGSLPNGVHYYIVRNPGYRGMADIALVQKAGKADEKPGRQGDATVLTRSALAYLPHFSQDSPFSYLKRKSIHPSSQGYATTGEDATIYRFENLVQARKGEIIDSTLLFVFDIISSEDSRKNELYSPENQAIIVSGDVEPDAIRGKMDILSMFITRRPAKQKEIAYSWSGNDTARIELGHSDGFAGVSAEYVSPRTSPSDMSTVLPLMTSRYISQLEIALKKRLEAALSQAMLPYASIDFSYVGSDRNPGDEKVSIGIRTEDEFLGKATEILASTLASLDVEGVSTDEYRGLVNEFMLKMSDRYGVDLEENSRYVDKCVAAFLYGSSLASDKSASTFFSKRDMDIETSTRLFNNFVAALLDKDSNLTLRCSSHSEVLSKDEMLGTFRQAWSSEDSYKFRTSIADSSALKKSSTKAKLKQSIAEPLTGGESWTFTNGIKVFFKKAGNNGHFNYSWLVKGGYSYMQGLNEGESAYLGDMLGSFRVGELSGREFRNMLNSNGISLEASVSLSELNISGSAKSSSLPLLMKSLISLAGERSVDNEAFELLRQRAERGMTADEAISSKLDSLMNRNMKLSPYRRAVRLSDDFAQKSMNYYDDCFSRMNDGALIIVGDLDSENVIKQLNQYLGAFRTDKAYAYRSRSTENILTSRKTLADSADDPAIGIRLRASINYTAENFMAANIASTFMEDAVARAVAKHGWTLRSQSTIEMFPEESLVMDFILKKADPDGMPATMACEDSADIVLQTARKAISDTGEGGITEEALKTGKNILLNTYTTWKNDPKTMTRMLVLRYSYGKDLMTDYTGKIAAVTVKNVNPVMASLARGGIAEYVIRKNHLDDFFAEIPPVEPQLPEIGPMKPAEGTFYYPYDGHSVPLDTIDLKSLEDLPKVYLEWDMLDGDGEPLILDVDGIAAELFRALMESDTK